MTLNLWQRKPKLTYTKDVFDIVQFGSSIIEGKTPNDLDIAVIFHKIPLKEQLSQAQDIKKQLQRISNLEIHIKSFDLYSLFDKSNFTKDNILQHGKSLISGKYFSGIFGLEPRILIKYSLNNLKKKDKVRFNYLLNGKKGKYGLLKKHGGRLLSPGLIEILSEFEEIFLSSMKKIASKIEVIKVLEKR